jgi:phosphate transport system permease protein
MRQVDHSPLDQEGLVVVRNYRWARANHLIPVVWKEETRSFSLTWDYFTSPPFEGSRFGGISFIIMNTLYMILGTSLLAIPLGVSSAIYLTHYSRRKSRLSSLIRSAFDVLSSLPAIIFGLFGMTVFVPIFGLGLISGCLSTTLMILPNITKASEEALKSVPKELYHASLALGATKFSSLLRVVIPSASTGIITGIILAIGRAFSEAAVLLFTLGTSLTQINNLHTSGRALTVHLYLILQEGGLSKAFPVAVVIILTVLILNIIADTIRDRLGRKLKN